MMQPSNAVDTTERSLTLLHAYTHTSRERVSSQCRWIPVKAGLEPGNAGLFLARRFDEEERAQLVRLRLLNLQPPSSFEVEGQAFVFASERLLRLPGEEVVATHVRNQWQVGDDHYLRLETLDPVECHFQSDGATERRGPFNRLVAVDGVLMADDRGLAMLKGARWKSLMSDAEWTRITIKQAR